MQNRWCYSTERMQKTLRAKCKNKHRIEASMVEAFITGEASNFVTAHYEAKNCHLHNPKPRYNADEPKKDGSNLSLFKEISHQPVVGNQYRWMLKNGGPFCCISLTT